MLRLRLPLALVFSALAVPALAAPDPMSAGNLQKVIIDAGTGDVTVTVDKTQHVKIDGQERDAKRAGKALTVKRATKDVTLTVPPHVALEINAAAGDVKITGAAKSLLAKLGSGDLSVSGPAKTVRATLGSGAAQLAVALAADGQVKVQTGSGDIRVTLSNDTAVRIDAGSEAGSVSGRKLSSKGAKARLRLKSGSGDIAIRRAE